jgi:hypothetical protein
VFRIKGSDRLRRRCSVVTVLRRAMDGLMSRSQLVARPSNRRCWVSCRSGSYRGGDCCSQELWFWGLVRAAYWLITAGERRAQYGVHRRRLRQRARHVCRSPRRRPGRSGACGRQLSREQRGSAARAGQGAASRFRSRSKRPPSKRRRRNSAAAEAQVHAQFAGRAGPQQSLQFGAHDRVGAQPARHA